MDEELLTVDQLGEAAWDRYMAWAYDVGMERIGEQIEDIIDRFAKAMSEYGIEVYPERSGIVYYDGAWQACFAGDIPDVYETLLLLGVSEETEFVTGHVVEEAARILVKHVGMLSWMAGDDISRHAWIDTQMEASNCAMTYESNIVEEARLYEGRASKEASSTLLLDYAFFKNDFMEIVRHLCLRLGRMALAADELFAA